MQRRRRGIARGRLGSLDERHHVHLIVADLYGGYEVVRLTYAGMEIVSRGEVGDVSPMWGATLAE